MGLHKGTREKIESCLREKIRAGEIVKDSVLAPQDIHNACPDLGIDPRTAEDHMPGLNGLEVEGPNFKGKIVEFIPGEGPLIKIDPPPPSRDSVSKSSSWSGDFLTYVAIGIGLTGIALGLWILFQGANSKSMSEPTVSSFTPVYSPGTILFSPVK